MADTVTLQNSLQSQENIFDFQNRQFTYIPDNNSGSYANGQIIFDAASLANSGKYVDWSQSLLVIPLVLNLNAVSGSFGNGLDSAFAASLKNGAHQLINSMSVELTNNQIVNLTSFSNLDINYKLLSTMSADDQINLSKTLLFSKDTAESVFYQGANTSALGAGECNNNIKQSTFTTTNGWGASGIDYNAGRLDRMLYGLISQSDYENGYGFIYVDLSRKQSQASDDIARSIQIVGTNSGLVACDLYCIIGYEREITISTATGSLII